MITIARFSKPEEAHLLRLRLEAGDVPAFTLDENTIQMDWLYSNAIGGVRVQIAEEDLEAAREILQELPIENLPADMPECPKCTSRNTTLDDLPRRLSFLSLLLIGFPLLFSKTRWKCLACNNTWNERNKENEISRT
ncbi:MAG: DUF2007 domain-containing protein [Chthoniobacterales bacterium]